jgi:hypothetical protein
VEVEGWVQVCMGVKGEDDGIVGGGLLRGRGRCFGRG